MPSPRFYSNGSMALGAARSASKPTSEVPPTPIIRFVRPGTESDVEAVSERVRRFVYKSFQQSQVAVLVSDMSGFTRLTRKYGIIHFASIIARTRQLFLPYFHKHNAMAITVEADTFNVVFPRVEDAVMAALAMQKATRMYNDSLTPEMAHFSMPLEGVGVDYGQGPLLDKAGKLLGSTFENAHMLGEELCHGNMIALSSAARGQLEACTALAGIEHKPLSVAEEKHEIAQALEDMGGAFEIRPTFDEAVDLAGLEDDRYLQGPLLSFAGRHSPKLSESDLQRLDSELRDRHMMKKVAVMFSFTFVNTDDAELDLSMKFQCLERLTEVFSRYNAKAEEDVLYMFDDPTNAILSVLECRRCMREMRAELADETQPYVCINGYGIHVGDVLCIDGTDIHWGDPVNTASKLGEEIATDEEVIISEATFKACHDDPRLRGLDFHQIDVTISKVNFHPYKVFGEVQQAGLPPGPEPVSRRLESVRSDILDKFLKSGLVKDAAIECDVLHRLLKVLDPTFEDADFDTIVNHLQRDPSSSGISLPAFVDWALETEHSGQLPSGAA